MFTPQRQESDNPKIGPHLNFTHPDKGILDDVAALVIHHAKRQTGNLNEWRPSYRPLTANWKTEICPLMFSSYALFEK